jgi:NitT/TauT family transport system substrate-binding protein
MFYRLLLGFVALASLVVQPAAAEDRKITFMVGSKSMFYMMQYIAEGGGFYKAEGLDVELLSVQSGAQMAAAVMGGSAEAGQFGVAHVVNASEGGGMVAVGNGYNMYPMAIVLSKAAMEKNGITSGMSSDDVMKRLRGLRIAITTPGSSTDQFIRTLFITRGMDADKEVSLQPMKPGAPMIAAMEQDSIDGFVGSSPFTNMVDNSGAGEILIDALAGNVPEFNDLPYQFIATTRDRLENDRPLIEAIVRAQTKTMLFVQQKPEEARAILKTYYPDMAEDEFNAAFDSGVKGMPTTPVIPANYYDNSLKMINLTEETPITLKYEDVIDGSVAEKVAQELSVSQ